MKTTALTVRRTKEGFELRCAYSYTGSAPTPAKRRDAALAMLKDVLEATEEGRVSDGGFSASDRARTGVGTVLVDNGREEGHG